MKRLIAVTIATVLALPSLVAAQTYWTPGRVQDFRERAQDQRDRQQQMLDRQQEQADRLRDWSQQQQLRDDLRRDQGMRDSIELYRWMNRPR